MLEKIREWLKGKKAYLLTASAILGALVAYVNSDTMTFFQLLQAVWVALFGSALRAGVAKIGK